MVRTTGMNGVEVGRTLDRLAHEIIEQLGVPTDYSLVGIVTGGWPIAERLADRIEQSTGIRPRTGTVDITLYRDDLYTGLEKPVLGETRLPFELTGQDIVLVDDVLFTGRTVRAALDVIMDYGRPRSVKLAVLVDRGHRELPVAADFTGRFLQTMKSDKVEVLLGRENSEDDRVNLVPVDGGKQ
jgi:pyrimidine operon attenuation protein/uracil phosphoribosyltransferase